MIEMQGAHLHLVRHEVVAMHALGVEQQVVERRGVDRARFLERPVGAYGAEQAEVGGGHGVNLVEVNRMSAGQREATGFTLCGAASGQYSDPGRACQPMRRSQVYTTIDRWTGWLLPPRCVLCRRPGQRPAFDLCARLRGRNPGRAGSLPALWPAARASGGGTADGCARCRTLDLPYARCLAPWAYEFPVTQLVQALKYEGALANARVFGTRMVAQALVSRTIHGVARHWSCPCRCTRPASSSAASTSRTKLRVSCRALLDLQARRQRACAGCGQRRRRLDSRAGNEPAT